MPPPGLGQASEVNQPAECDLPAPRFFAQRASKANSAKFCAKFSTGSCECSEHMFDSDTESTRDGSSQGLPNDDVEEDEGEELPSIGSAGHKDGLCRPCHYAPTKRGCSMGSVCDFCHFPHQKRSKKRAPRTERGEGLALVQAVYDAERGGDAKESHLAETKLLLFVSPDPRRAAYASAVLRGLRSGAVLHSIESHV